MARFLEFLTNHWILSGIWLLLLVALFAYLKKKSGKAVSVHQVTQLINRSDAQVLDIRDKKVFDKGHIVGAMNIPLAKLNDRLGEVGKNKDKPVIVVCHMGHQSGEAVKKLEAAGYTQVYRLSGGMVEWQGQSMPIVV